MRRAARIALPGGPLRPLLVIALALALPRLTHAQDAEILLPQRHNVYLEILGNAYRYSLNYERTLAEHHRLRFGLGMWTGGETTAITETELTLPMMYNVLVGSGPHYLELGAGVVVGVVNRDEGARPVNGSFYSATDTIGYRHQLPSLEWIFRIGYTPIYGIGDGEIVYPRKGYVSRFGISIDAPSTSPLSSGLGARLRVIGHE